MRPLVVLHGLFGSSRNWKSISKILSERTGNKNIRTIDLRNHNIYYGASSIEGPINNWDVLHKDLENYWKTNLDSKEFDILGHSFGGQIAMTSILNQNSLLRNYVNKLIVVDVSLRHPSVSNDNDHLHQLMKAMKSFDDVKFYNKDQVIDKLKNVEPNSHVINFLLLNMVKLSDGSFSFKNLNLKYLIEAWPKLKNQWEEIVRKHSVPWDGQVLFLKGENSDYIQSDDIADMKHYFPNHKLEVIANSGHWPHFDNQVDFVNKVIKFL